MALKTQQQLNIGEWCYLPDQERLIKLDANGVAVDAVQLDNLSQKVLNYFIANPGRLLTKEEILFNVWGLQDEQSVQIAGGRLSRVIRVLRQSLGDDTAQPRYIETITKRGFRFIAAVELTPIDVTLDQLNEAQRPRQRLPAWYNISAMIKNNILIFMLLLALVCTLPFWSLPLFEQKSALPFGRFHAVSSLVGLEYNPVVSQDGRYLAFNHKTAQDQHQIVVQDLLHYDTHVLFESSDVFSGIAWHPNGQALAFIRPRQASPSELTVAYLSDDRSTVRKEEVLALGSKRSLTGRVSWSPDGAFLVYTTTPEGKQQSVLMLHALHQGNAEQLTTPPQTSVGDYAARFSKKGDQIVFLRDVGGARSQVWIFDLESRESRMLAQLEDSYPANVDWFQDDQKILVPASPSRLLTIDVHTGELATLQQTDVDASDIFVTAQGRIFATIGQYRRTHIYRSQNPLRYPQPQVEPLFQSSRSERMIELPSDPSLPSAVLSNRSGLFQFWFHYPDGRQLQVSQFTKWLPLRGMSFSPDGRRLLASVGSEVWIFSAEETPKMLSQLGEITREPSWSHDGQSIYFSRSVQGRWQIVKADIATATQTVVALDLDYFQQSFDGQYHVQRRSANAQYELIVKGRDEAIALPVVAQGNLIPHFVLRKNAIYFSANADGNQLVVHRFDLATRELQSTGLEISQSFRRFAVSMDENYIYIPKAIVGDMDIATLQ